MKRFGGRAATLIAFLLLVLGAGATSAFAQVPPLPQPTIPPQVQPVFEVISPTVYPQCGTATLLAFLLIPNVAPQIAPQVLSATGPLFVVCGTVPRPPQQYTCLLDVQQQEVLNTVFEQAGVPPPLFIHPEGDVVEQTILIVDQLPPPASTSGVQTTLPELLVCASSSHTSPAPRDSSSAPTDSFAPPAYKPPVAGHVSVLDFLDRAPPIQPPAALALSAPPQNKLGVAADDLRRRLGTTLGVALLLLSILYWSDGFGVVPLRSTLAARAWRKPADG